MHPLKKKVKKKTKIKNKRKIYINDLLKPEIIDILNDLRNYSKDYDPSKKLSCKLCNRTIEDSLQLILWNSDQKLYISFHSKCAFLKGTADLFNEIAGEFDYTYMLNDKKAYYI